MTKQRKKKEETCTERDQLILDHYYANGFNGRQAVLEVVPGLTDNSASVVFNTIIKKKANRSYIDEKKARLRASTDIQHEQLTNELRQWAYADATTFIGLEPSQIKELPPDVRRCIQSYKTRTHYDKEGNYNGTTVELKLVDKQKALESLAKHIGYFELDNSQKATKLNLTKIEKGTLNVLLQAMENNE